MIRAIFGFLFSIFFAVQALISIFSFGSDSLISVLGPGFTSFLIALFSWYEIKDDFTKRFILSANTIGTGQGTIIKIPEADSYPEGTVVTLKVKASENSRFIRWEGDENSTSEIIKIKMNSKKEVIAIFTEIETFPLQVDAIGMGMGTITRTPEAYAGRHPKDTVVTLTAKASENSKFLRWDGDATGTSDTCTITMDKAKEVCAVFAQMFPLKVNLHGGGKGSITRTPEADTYLDGTVVTLTANASKGSKFTRWAASPLKTVSGQTCTVTICSRETIGAWFEPLDYFPLAISKIGTGEGEVTSTPEADTHRENTVVTLTAKASENSKFVCWEGDASGASETCTLTMDRAKKVSAVFVDNQFRLRVYTIGTGTGRITRTPELDMYPEGTVVTLTAKPSGNSIFLRWEGDGNGSRETCTVTMNSAKSVSAVFKELFPLKVDVVGTGGGTISRMPEGYMYLPDTIVVLKAKPSVGSKFVRWNGDGHGFGQTFTVTMNSSRKVSAWFEPLDYFPLTISKIGTGEGEVTRTPTADTYEEGAVVTLKAKASENSKFVRWEGDASGASETCTVSMDKAKKVSAVFAACFPLQVDAIGAGNGIITRTPEADIYEEGTVVTLAAKASENSKFVRWEGDVTGASETHKLTMDSAKRVIAVFTEIKMFALQVDAIGTGQGTITQTPEADAYVEGTVVKLTANPSTGSKFVRWGGDANGSAETCTVILNAAMSIVAEFESVETAPSQRIEALEHNLMLALKQIEQLQRQLSQAAAPNLPTLPREVPPTTASDPLLDILKWLATQERVALSEFRRRLLPLDLLTGAVIEDVNERALDVRGEMALEEDGDDIVVMQDVLAAVLVAWTPRQH